MKAMFAALLMIGSFSVAQASDVKVDSILCYVQETGGAPVIGSKFFDLASKTAVRDNTCVVARIKGEESGRIYDSNGRRLGKVLGQFGGGNDALSHKEIKEVKALYGLSRCKNYTCVESIL